jgi:UDP-galactopyranose mutase
LTGQSHPGTSVVREYPQSQGEPYYPVPTAEAEELYRRYDAMAKLERNVRFVGRLAKYKYFNMDQVVASALKAAGDVIND